MSIIVGGFFFRPNLLSALCFSDLQVDDDGVELDRLVGVWRVFTDQAHLHRTSAFGSIKGCDSLSKYKTKGLQQQF